MLEGWHFFLFLFSVWLAVKLHVQHVPKTVIALLLVWISNLYYSEEKLNQNCKKKVWILKCKLGIPWWKETSLLVFKLVESLLSYLFTPQYHIVLKERQSLMFWFASLLSCHIQWMFLWWESIIKACQPQNYEAEPTLKFFSSSGKQAWPVY